MGSKFFAGVFTALAPLNAIMAVQAAFAGDGIMAFFAGSVAVWAAYMARVHWEHAKRGG